MGVELPHRRDELLGVGDQLPGQLEGVVAPAPQVHLREAPQAPEPLVVQDDPPLPVDDQEAVRGGLEGGAQEGGRVGEALLRLVEGHRGPLDADVAHRLAGGVAEGEDVEVDQPALPVPRGAHHLAPVLVRPGEGLSDLLEDGLPHVDGRRLPQQDLVRIPQEGAVRLVLLQVRPVQIDDGDRVLHVLQNGAVDGEGKGGLIHMRGDGEFAWGGCS